MQIYVFILIPILKFSLPRRAVVHESLEHWHGAPTVFPATSGVEPQPKSNLVHFSIKIWHLITTVLIIVVAINWPNLLYAVKIIKANKGGGTNSKVGIGLQIICERSQPNFFELSYAELQFPLVIAQNCTFALKLPYFDADVGCIGVN